MSDADSTDETAFHRERAILYLAIGVLLVVSPAVISPVGDALELRPSYTYEAVEVTVQNGTLVFDGPPPDDGIEDVDCFGEYSRLCGLEVEQLDGNVTVGKVNPVEREAARYAEFLGSITVVSITETPAISRTVWNRSPRGQFLKRFPFLLIRLRTQLQFGGSSGEIPEPSITNFRLPSG